MTMTEAGGGKLVRMGARRPRFAGVTLALLWFPILLVGLLLLGWVFVQSARFSPETIRFRWRAHRVHAGMSAREVERLLGPPQAVYGASDFGKSFPIEGWTWDGSRVTYRVWAYSDNSGATAYVYLDRRGEVHHAYRGRGGYYVD